MPPKYKFKPSIKIWFSKKDGKSFSYFTSEEIGGIFITTGWFSFIQLKLFAIHIKINFKKLW